MTQDEFQRYEKAAKIVKMQNDAEYILRNLRNMKQPDQVIIEDAAFGKKVYLNDDDHLCLEIRDAVIEYIEDKIRQLGEEFAKI